MHARLAPPLVVVLCLVSLLTPARASHNEDDHSDNMKLLLNIPKSVEGITQSDLAFWGDLMAAGNYNGFRLFDLSSPTDPELIVDYFCPASQNDISIWKNLLILSIDGPRGGAKCGSAEGTSFEGIRIFSIKDARSPKFIKGVKTTCGSHTHTLSPGPNVRGRIRDLYVYISSYSSCPAGTTWTNISVIKIPLGNPGKAKVIDTPDMGGSCHDVTVFRQLKIAAGACRNTGSIWDISNPAKPEVTATIQNPGVRFWHSAGFTWDGKYVAFGDETFGGTGPACPTDNSPIGGVWAYEVDNPAVPVGQWFLPRGQGNTNCTAHNFNWIPVQDRYLMVIASYNGGTSIVDWTDPANAEEIGYYDAAEPASDTWSSYFYNGYIYANDIERGIDIFFFKDPASGSAKRLPFMNPQTQMKRLFTP